MSFCLKCTRTLNNKAKKGWSCPYADQPLSSKDLQVYKSGCPIVYEGAPTRILLAVKK